MDIERQAANDAIIKALIDVLLTMPSLHPDIRWRLEEMRSPYTTVQQVGRIALDISNLCFGASPVRIKQPTVFISKDDP